MKYLAVFDVDRTIIKKTSWYYACTYPDLLIKEEDIEKFKELNEYLFKKDNKLFRTETLKLIQNHNCKIPKKILMENKLIGNKEIDIEECYQNEFYYAGRLCGKKIGKYKEPFLFINILERFYGDNITFCFLSSGYEDFIKGVVDECLFLSGIKINNYKIIGSKFITNGGQIVESEHIDYNKKEEIIKKLSELYKIVFYADDSDEAQNIMTYISSNGGHCLKIIYDKDNDISLSWESFFSKINIKNIVNYLKNQDKSISVAKADNDSAIFEYIKSKTDKIGIVRISYKEYNTGINELEYYTKKDISRYLDGLVFKKDNYIYLRNLNYYNFLPPYVNFTLKDSVAMQKEFFSILCTCIEELNSSYIDYKNLKKESKILLFTVLDNFFEFLLRCLYYFEVKKNNNDNECASSVRVI